GQCNRVVEVRAIRGDSRGPTGNERCRMRRITQRDEANSYSQYHGFVHVISLVLPFQGSKNKPRLSRGDTLAWKEVARRAVMHARTTRAALDSRSAEAYVPRPPLEADQCE